MEFVPIIIKQIPTLLSLFAIFCVYFFYYLGIYNFALYRFVTTYTFLSNKWFFDQVYNFYIGVPLFRLAYRNCYKVLDKGFLELCGPFGITNFIFYFTKRILLYQSGFIYSYVCLFVLGFFFFLVMIDLL